MRCELRFFDFSRRLHARLRLPFFFFNDTATSEIYTLSLHDALPILIGLRAIKVLKSISGSPAQGFRLGAGVTLTRSEEHTSELQSHLNLVCRLLLEKKKEETHTRYSPYIQSATIAYRQQERTVHIAS